MVAAWTACTKLSVAKKRGTPGRGNLLRGFSFAGRYNQQHRILTAGVSRGHR